MQRLSVDQNIIKWANDFDLTTYEDVVHLSADGINMGVSINKGPGSYLLCVSVEQDFTWDDEVRDTLNDTFWGLGKASYDAENGFLSITPYGKKPREKLQNLGTAATRMSRALKFAGILPRLHCYSCGGKTCDNAVDMEGFILPAHTVCTETDHERLSKTVRFSRPNYGLATLAAFLGAIFSTVVTVLLAVKMDLLIDIFYIALPVCSAVSYRAAQGKQGKVMYAIIAITSVVAAFLTLMLMFYLSHSVIWGYYLPLGAFLNAFIQPGVIENCLLILARVMIYTMFGLVLTFTLLHRVVKIGASVALVDTFTASRKPVTFSERQPERSKTSHTGDNV